MARAGGEADKLGNRYEGIWTVENLLDVLSGEALSLTIEPLGKDALGIEFIKDKANDIREFHSVKRQTTGDTWRIAQLVSGNGNSILGRLFQKLESYKNSQVIFVSGTTANQLYELTEQASRLKKWDIHLGFEPAWVVQTGSRQRLKSSFLTPQSLQHNNLKRFVQKKSA